MTKKHFDHISFNTTKQVEAGGFVSRLTGKNDLVFLRNRWQTEIDNAWAALMNMAHYLETCEDSIEIIVRFNSLAKLRGEIQDSNVKRERMYVNVFKYIQKDQEYSERMWKIHQDMYKASPTNTGNYSKSKHNINITHGEIKKYVSMYPQIEIKNDIQLIKDLENNIEKKKSIYRENVTHLRNYFEQFKLELIKCETKYNAYNKILAEGKAQLNNSRYRGTIFHSILTEQQKSELEIDTLKHRIEQVEQTLAHYRDIKAKVEKELEVESSNMQRTLAGEFEFSDSLDSV
jgi:hypothetical protein